MDARHRRRPSGDRFLTAFSLSPPSTAAPSDASDELSEDDVFFAGATADLFNPPSTSTSATLHHHNNHRHHIAGKTFNHQSSFGILAALPESGEDRTTSTSIVNHKQMMLSSPPSSSRMIPVVPRPSTMAERQILSMPGKYGQSAPMNVPMMQMRERRRRKGSMFGYEDNLENEDEDDDDGEMLPPHEIVARQMAKSPVLSCSVLEGAGRTLKGRDLRQDIMPDYVACGINYGYST